MMDECLYLMNKNYRKGYDDGIQDSPANLTLEKIAKLFEGEFVYRNGWALYKLYEIKDILEKEYWDD